ncbi:hypothetical protein [Oceanobacillus kimchii]|uniref:hypothetical protein n=1 Tax=Oceanobacillus kimchii TaxID=746691 RepID=UPI00232E4BFD|nr:hypothetical protein [Oceanobacillus kimchii]
MKKVFLLVILSILLTGCGEYSLNDVFEKDLEQVLGILDEAYENNRELTDDEYDITKQFDRKYGHGQFDNNDNVYVMNDLERAIAEEVSILYLFTDSNKGTLESEKTFYEESRDKIDKYLNEKDIPEKLKGSFKTYEIRSSSDIHSQFKNEALEIMDSFEGLVNGSETTVYFDYEIALDEFIEKYESNDFEVDGKNYLLTNDERNIFYMAKKLKEDIDSNVISSYTVTSFNSIKEMIE